MSEPRDHGCQGDSWSVQVGNSVTVCDECGRTLDDIESSKINAAVDAAKEREMEGL